MNKAHTIYIPAFSYERVRFSCDTLVKWAMREAAIDNRLVEQGGVEKGQRVLDLGCGFATLATMIKKTQPGAEVIGIDEDKKTLEIAQVRTRKQNIGVSLFDAMAYDIPCRDNYFDRVFSNMLFHHHATKDKIRTAKEIYRILKPGGELHLADFGRPQNALMGLIARIARKVEGAEDNIQGLLPHILHAANFVNIVTTVELMTIFGTISLLRAKKPRQGMVPSQEGSLILGAEAV